MLTNTLAAFVERRLEAWGREFALHRDCEYLGHQSKNMLQVLKEHRGEMPRRAVGFKPLEVDADAMAVEVAVHELGLAHPRAACVMRAWYCGRGRVQVERLEQAEELIRALPLEHRSASISRAQYRALRDVGVAYVAGRLQERMRA